MDHGNDRHRAKNTVYVRSSARGAEECRILRVSLSKLNMCYLKRRSRTCFEIRLQQVSTSCRIFGKYRR